MGIRVNGSMHTCTSMKHMDTCLRWADRWIGKGIAKCKHMETWLHCEKKERHCDTKTGGWERSPVAANVPSHQFSCHSTSFFSRRNTIQISMWTCLPARALSKCAHPHARTSAYCHCISGPSAQEAKDGLCSAPSIYTTALFFERGIGAIASSVPPAQPNDDNSDSIIFPFQPKGGFQAA